MDMHQKCLGFLCSIAKVINVFLLLAGHALAAWLFCLSFEKGLSVVTKPCIVGHEFSRPLHVFLLLSALPVLPNVTMAIGVFLFNMFDHPFFFAYDAIIGIIELINGLTFIFLFIWCGKIEVHTWAAMRDAAETTLAGGMIHLQLSVLERCMANDDMKWPKRANKIPRTICKYFTLKCCRVTD